MAHLTTLICNMKEMRAREKSLASRVWGDWSGNVFGLLLFLRTKMCQSKMCPQ